MRRALAAITALLAAAAARAGDESERASVEVVAQRTTVYAGELVRLTVRIEYDEAFFRDQAVPLFSRKMDVPLRVEAPWLRAIRGMEPFIPNERGWRNARYMATIAVGDDVELVPRYGAEVTGGGERSEILVDRNYVAREPGEVTLDAPELRFAYATRFEDDFVDGRRGVDRNDVVVRGEALALRVLAVPAEGRPPTYTGAVGRSFAIRAETSQREVAAGESFRVTLRIDGEGHLASFDAPRLDGLAGLHVYGALDDRGAAARTIGYDVSALDASVREFPAIEWSYFDTSDPPSYRTLRTEPIPLTVRAAGTPDASTSPSATDEGASAELWAALAAGATALVAAIAWIVSRRRTAAPDPADVRRAAAAEAVRGAAAAPGGDVGAAFTEYLAARLGCAPAAVVGADLARRLASAGVPDALAARAASALDALVASRYGGSGAPTAGELVALVGEMETASPRL